jgi:Na+-driven multidrug efflux pump
MAMATFAAIAGNVLLIPGFNEVGAAWATVAAEAVLLAGTYYGVRRFTRMQRDDDDSDPG